MQRQKIVLRYAEALVCELIDVVRNHHESMPGPGRDRPGMDRVRLRTPDGERVVVDLWSASGQDVARAPQRIEVFDGGELLRWRPAPPMPSTVAREPGQAAATRVLELPVHDVDPAPRTPAPPAVLDVATSSLPGNDRGPTRT